MNILDGCEQAWLHLTTQRATPKIALFPIYIKKNRVMACPNPTKFKHGMSGPLPLGRPSSICFVVSLLDNLDQEKRQDVQ